MKKAAKNWLTAIKMVVCFLIALAAPEIILKAPAPATIGYLASIGFLCFAIRFLILMGRMEDKEV